MSAKYEYRLEMFLENEWYSPFGLRGSLSYLRGYIDGRADAPPPTLAMRIVRSDGRIVEQRNARLDVDIGLVASWPSPEQYEEAARRALDKAKAIRERLARS